MNNKKRGVAFVFNHYEFERLAKREGTHVDCERIEKEFEKLSFEVIIKNDLTLWEINLAISEIALRDHSDNDCLVIIVLTHGESSNYIYAKDRKYEVDQLWEPFVGDKCKTLIGKPKLFFIQACRGTKLDDGVQLPASDSFTGLDMFDGIGDPPMFKIPSMADFLVMYATYEDHYAFRNPTTGSWFIQSLCDELEENGKTADLLSMLTGVVGRVAFHYQSNVPRRKEMDEKKQCPVFVSTLTRALYFTPKLAEAVASEGSSKKLTS